MIDKLFTALEDIYFKVLDDSQQESNNEETVISFTGSSLSPMITQFKEISSSTVYIGKSGDRFKLLKLATLILNFILYEDDNKLSEDELILINKYIKNKLSRLTSIQKDELNKTFDIRVCLNDLKTFINDNELPSRSIDMIMDKIVDHINNNSRYFLPTENIYVMLIEVFE